MQLRVGLQRRVHRAHDKVGDVVAVGSVAVAVHEERVIPRARERIARDATVLVHLVLAILHAVRAVRAAD